MHRLLYSTHIYTSYDCTLFPLLPHGDVSVGHQANGDHVSPGQTQGWLDSALRDGCRDLLTREEGRRGERRRWFVMKLENFVRRHCQK